MNYLFRKILIGLFFLATLLLQGTDIYTETANVAATWTTVCELPTWNFTNVSFSVHNTGATNPFTDCKVEQWVGPDPDDWTIVSSSWADCKALVAGAKTSWSISGVAFSKMRVQAKSALTTTSYCRQYGTK